MNIFDNDLYKFTMWNIVSQLYPNVKATYKAYDRGGKYNKVLGNSFDLKPRMYSKWAYINECYLSELEIHRITTILEDKYGLINKNNLQNLRDNYIKLGNIFEKSDKEYWENSILYEVPNLYEASEKYYAKVLDERYLREDVIIQTTINKLERLNGIGEYYNRVVEFSELGTRRRISQSYQDIVLKTIKENINKYSYLDFKGTSNVYLGIKNDIPLVGTMAHEWIMAHSVLNSIHKANYYALNVWKDFYKDKFGVALTDTYGTKNFFNTLDGELKDHYKIVRHDSGDPIDFIYESRIELGDDTKILFSDSVNDGVVERIFGKIKNSPEVKVAFGIGSWFTAKPYDNFDNLNIVIKLDTINGHPVCKLSDEPGKESGNQEIIDLTKSTLKFFGDI